MKRTERKRKMIAVIAIIMVIIMVAVPTLAFLGILLGF